MTNIDKYKDWTKYHVSITLNNEWKFWKEGSKRSIITHKDRNEVIRTALYHLSEKGGYCFVHYKDGSIDFIIDNWCG